jgi:hypothetical protein
MAVAYEANTANTVKAPNIDPTISGCEKVLPLLIVAWKQPISVCVELAKIRMREYPSKSGMLRAIDGIPAMSLADIEVVMYASMG